MRTRQRKRPRGVITSTSNKRVAHFRDRFASYQALQHPPTDPLFPNISLGASSAIVQRCANTLVTPSHMAWPPCASCLPASFISRLHHGFDRVSGKTLLAPGSRVPFGSITQAEVVVDQTCLSFRPKSMRMLSMYTCCYAVPIRRNRTSSFAIPFSVSRRLSFQDPVLGLVV
jgi:hypothetical protein